jgi:hypothetical protein
MKIIWSPAVALIVVLSAVTTGGIRRCGCGTGTSAYFDQDRMVGQIERQRVRVACALHGARAGQRIEYVNARCGRAERKGDLM